MLFLKIILYIFGYVFFYIITLPVSMKNHIDYFLLSE